MTYQQKYYQKLDWRTKLAKMMYSHLRYLAFPEIRHQYTKWQRENPAKARKLSLSHYYRNKHLYRAGDSRRRARMLGAITGDQSAVAKIYSAAAKLRSEGKHVAVDHVIPLCKGGKHSPENLQIIGFSENLKKGIKLDYKPEVIFGY